MPDFSYLLGAKPVDIPDPLQQAGRMFQLQNAATQGRLSQLQLAQSQRQDAAQQGLQQALPGLDLTDKNAVMAAMQANPQAAQAILQAAQTAAKNNAAVGKDQAETANKQADTKTKLLAAIGGQANALSQDPNLDPGKIKAFYSAAQGLGVDPQMLSMPDNPSDPDAWRQTLKGIANLSFKTADQVHAQQTAAQQAETGRHNLASEQQAATTQQQTGAYQRGELANSTERNRIASVQADPWGILGIGAGGAQPAQAPQPPQQPPQQPGAPVPNTFAGGTPQLGTLPNGNPGYSPQAMSQFDQQRMAVLQKELADQQATGRVDPALTQEIAIQQQRMGGQQGQPQGQPQAQPQGQPDAPAQLPDMSRPQPGRNMSVRDAISANLHGADFLQTLPPALASQVQRLAEGKQQVPTGAALRSPQVMQLMALVSQYDPTFDSVDYGMRYKTAQDFAPQGKSGQNITALNTAIGHLSGLNGAMQSLDNFGGMATPLNSIVNPVEKAFGDPRQANVEMHANAVAGELAKVFRSTGMSESDINSWKSAIGMNMSPDQQKQVVASAIDLMNSRLQAIGDAYSRGMGKASAGMELLSPEARQAYANLTGGAHPPAEASAPVARQPGTQNVPPPDAPAIKSAPTQTAFNSMPDPAKYSGRKIASDDGTVYQSDGSTWKRVK